MQKWVLLIRIGLLLAATSPVCYAQVDTKWKIHDLNRPVPPVIDPGTPSTQDSPGRPPLVNASRPPGQWQMYDIVFHGPRFDKEGKLTRPARVTVLHNGALVQDNVELSGPTANGARPPYAPQPEKLPLALQDHNNPIRFRNIWIRELN